MNSAEYHTQLNFTVLVVFSYGNIFKPSTGSESRLYHITRGLSNYLRVITLETISFGKYINYPVEVKNRYFFNDLMIKNVHFGVFFSDLNPFYYFKIYNIIKKERPDIIQISYPRGLLAAKFCIWLNRKKTLLIYEALDLQVEVDEVNANDPSIPFIKRYVIKLYDQILEKIAVNIADHITTVSFLDKNKFIDRYSINPQKLTVIPSPIEIFPINNSITKFDCKDFLGIERNKIMIFFHGVYNYIPNKEAVNLIENFISPTISQFCDDVIFVIAGKGSPTYKKNNIISLGFVEDLDKLLRAADIAIVPILKGGGTRIKILDYMGAGLPIVSTKKGIEGIDASNYEEAIIVDFVNHEFINAIKCFIQNEDLRNKIGFKARKLAEDKYEFKNVGYRLSNLYRELLDGSKK